MSDKVLPAGWVRESLGNVLHSIVGGGTPDKGVPEYFQGDIPLMTVKDMKATRPSATGFNITEEALVNSSSKLVPADTVVIATRMGLGKVVRPIMPTAINQDLKALFPSEALDKSFLEHWLISIASKIEAMGTGTTVKGVRLNQIRELEMPLAPLNEQRRIVEKIETLFARLDQGEADLRQVQTLLARYRQSVLKAAVTGQLTADWRTENAHRLEPGRDLLARILRTRRETWQGRGKYKEPIAPDTTHLSDLPDGWVWASVDQVTSLFKNGMSKKPTSKPNELPILRISAVRPMSVSLEDLRYYSPSASDEIESFWVKRGDLLFTRYSGSAHYVGVCGQLREDLRVLHPDKLIKARPISAAGLNTDYLELAWNTGATRKYIAANIKTTSGQQGIAGADIKAAPFPLPTSEEQAVIAGKVWEAIDRIELMESVCQTELTRSSALRQSILKQAFAGRLVPQDQNDEPATELLARIRAASEQTPKQGKARRNTKA